MGTVMVNETRKNIEKLLEKGIDGKEDLTHWKMIHAIKLTLCDFEKKIAESKNGKKEIEQLIIQMEMIVEKLSERTAGHS
ncbi:MAG: hypothetical protein ACI86X_001320 [Moritella sp.]|jgi:hypothetical protein